MQSAESIERALRSHRYRFANERELQAGIAQVLATLGIEFAREAPLEGGIADPPKAGRVSVIDFLIGDVGVEVKIKGSLPEVTRQVHRYLQSPRIGSLLLVTTRAALARLPKQISGKTVRAFHLVTGAF